MKIVPGCLRLDQQPLLAQYLLFPRRDFTPPPPGAFDLKNCAGQAGSYQERRKDGAK